MGAVASELDEAELTESQTRSARQIVLQAALLGLLADSVFRNAQEGLGWTIWIVALAVSVVLVARYRDQRLTAEQAGWLSLAVISATAVAWRAAEELQVWNTLATLIALALFSMVSAGRPASSIFSSRLRDVFVGWVFAARDGLFGALGLIFRDAELGSAIRDSAAARRPVLRAAVLTLPLFIVFTVLLSRADPVFGAIFRLPDVDVETIASHVFLGGVFAWLSAGFMRGAMLPSGRQFSVPDRLPIQIGVVEVTASLGAVLGLFAVFVAIQLRWLFGGADVVQATTGLSVAEYARRGFFELVAVSALVLPLILGTRAAIDDPVAMRRHTRLSVALLILLGAIIASALLRMRLYVEYFGLTTDRLYALAFMTWLAVVFLGLGFTVLRHWHRPFAAICALSGFATLFALTLANPERIVANVNLNRTATTPVDYEYLARLSGDAAPVVAKALAAAQPSAESCGAARTLRGRALTRAGVKQANLGAAGGYSAVLQTLQSRDIQRLCGS